jgi:phage tail tape-measure protein
MALLDDLGFEGKYNSVISGLFKNNITQAIDEEDLRALVTDMLDSLLHQYDNSVMRDCGTADLSSDTWPTTGGKGAGGAILKNNSFRVSVAGDPPGAPITVAAGMIIVANQDSPTTGTHWDIITTDGSSGGITAVDGGTI